MAVIRVSPVHRDRRKANEPYVFTSKSATGASTFRSHDERALEGRRSTLVAQLRAAGHEVVDR